jgi:hypothetical protein
MNLQASVFQFLFQGPVFMASSSDGEESRWFWQCLINCAKQAQESVMNARGNYLFDDVLSQTLVKYNNQYYADNHSEECSKRQYYWMRNKEQYLHTLSNGQRF